MILQWVGPLMAFLTVATIGAGHVMVRKINYHFGTKFAPLVVIIGASVLGLSSWVTSDLISAALGIVGITTLWDGVELYRQEARVRKGHAPMNPKRELS
jgi:uncharacterized protein DUF4491